MADEYENEGNVIEVGVVGSGTQREKQGTEPPPDPA
jgi:hypothetical protein